MPWSRLIPARRAVSGVTCAFALLLTAALNSHIRASDGASDHRHASASQPPNRDFVYSEYLQIQEAVGDSVGWDFGCYFSIEDNNGDYWPFTYVARLWDPDGRQIAYHTAWAYKPSFSSNLTTHLVDPAPGTYRCTIDWWIDEYQVPQREATQNLSYLTPIGETTESGGWWTENTTVHRWNQTLTGGSFVGRGVWEEDPGGGGPDTCWYVGSEKEKFEAVTTPGLIWNVGANSTWGPDLVGWSYQSVLYYRTNGRSPCDTRFYQDMWINPVSSPTKYVTNLLRAGITDISVWSERAGQQVERIYP